MPLALSGSLSRLVLWGYAIAFVNNIYLIYLQKAKNDSKQFTPIMAKYY
ncbi:MAG: hypothetical protein HC903_30135 [Methylacidiphilales bacterium]|nr:hypothetical protein [Candidatus Methylacidiphilales bacterium]